MQISSFTFKELFNLERTVVENVNVSQQSVKFAGSIYDQKVMNLSVRPDLRWIHRCPHCMSTCSVYDHQSGLVSWRAPSINGTITYFNYAPARISCPEHGVIREYIPWADGMSRFTADFNNAVAWMALQLPKTAISTYFQINWHTVGNCINAAHARLEPNPLFRLINLRKICVDETSIAKGYKYITVVYDMERCQVIWIHEGHGYEIFKKFALLLSPEQRSNIELVAGDGARWIDTVTIEDFPNASRGIDPFHLVGWCNDAVDDVRRESARAAKVEYEKTEKAFLEALDMSTQALEQAKKDLAEAETNGDFELAERLKKYIYYIEKYMDLCEKNKKKNIRYKFLRKLREHLSGEQKKTLDELKKRAETLKNARYAVLKNPENRTFYQNDKLSLIEASDPSLYLAYRLKESMRRIAHMKDAAGAADEIDRWIEQSSNSGLPPFVALAEKIGRHKENLLNSIRLGANSAQSESCNALIKTLIRMGRGFRNFANLTALIFLKCSQIVIPLANRPQYSAEQMAEKRQKAKEYRLKRQAVKMAAMQAQATA